MLSFATLFYSFWVIWVFSDIFLLLIQSNSTMWLVKNKMGISSRVLQLNDCSQIFALVVWVIVILTKFAFRKTFAKNFIEVAYWKHTFCFMFFLNDGIYYCLYTFARIVACLSKMSSVFGLIKRLSIRILLSLKHGFEG